MSASMSVGVFNDLAGTTWYMGESANENKAAPFGAAVRRRETNELLWPAIPLAPL